jgi:hypothetical protein
MVADKTEQNAFPSLEIVHMMSLTKNYTMNCIGNTNSFKKFRELVYYIEISNLIPISQHFFQCSSLWQ